MHSSNKRFEEVSSKTSHQLREASSDKKRSEMSRDLVTPVLQPYKEDLTIIKEQVQGEGNQTLRLSVDMLNIEKDSLPPAS